MYVRLICWKNKLNTGKWRSLCVCQLSQNKPSFSSRRQPKWHLAVPPTPQAKINLQLNQNQFHHFGTIKKMNSIQALAQWLRKIDLGKCILVTCQVEKRREEERLSNLTQKIKGEWCHQTPPARKKWSSTTTLSPLQYCCSNFSSVEDGKKGSNWGDFRRKFESRVFLHHHILEISECSGSDKLSQK